MPAYAALFPSSLDCPPVEPLAIVPVGPLNQAQGRDSHMMKITLAVAAAAAVLTTAPLATPRPKASG